MKNPGPALSSEQLGGEDAIPPEFRAAMQRKTTQQARPNPDTPEALSPIIVESKVETNRTDERVRTTVTKAPGPIILRSVNTNDQGQPVQIVRTMDTTDELTPPTPPDATTNVAVRDLGNGQSIEEVSVEGTYDENGNFIPGVFSGNLFSKEKPSVIPQDFQPSFPQITTRIDEAGTAVPPTLSPDELQESQEQISQFKKRTQITTQPIPELFTGSELNGTEFTQYGIANVTRRLSLDADVDPILHDLTTEQTTRELGNGLTIKEDHWLQSSPPIISSERDPVYLIKYTTRKEFVPLNVANSSLFSVAGNTSTLIEYQSFDTIKQIQLTTKIEVDSLPPDKEWFEYGQHSFPDELLSYGVQTKVIVEVSASVSSSGGDAVTTTTQRYETFLNLDIREGYSGPVLMKVTEKFSMGPPQESDIPTVVQWAPQGHVVLISANYGSGSDVLVAGRQVTIPPCLHSTITNSSITPNSIAATEPPELPHGDYIVKHVESVPWRLGVWRTTIYEMKVP